MEASREQARIAALLTGESLPAHRLLECATNFLAPMAGARGRLGILFGTAVEIAVGTLDDEETIENERSFTLVGDAGEIRLSVPRSLASWAGSTMLGGSGKADREPGPLDWHLAPLWIDALARALGPDWQRVEGPFKERRDTVPVALRLTAEDRSFAVPVELPTALVMPRNRTPSARNGHVALATREAATLALTATIDLRAADIRRLTTLRPGDVLPLAGGLADVRLREGERTLFGGTLGRSNGQYSVRLSAGTRPAEFQSVQPSDSPKQGSHAKGVKVDAEGRAA